MEKPSCPNCKSKNVGYVIFGKRMRCRDCGWNFLPGKTREETKEDKNEEETY